MRRHATALVAGCVLAIASSGPVEAANTNTELAPSSRWVVNWPDDSCLLARQFGSDEEPVFLTMRSYAPGYNFEITLSGKPVAAFRWPDKATVAFGSGAPAPINPIPSASETYGPAILFFDQIGFATAANSKTGNHVYPDLDLEAHLDGIELATNSRTLTLKTGQMASAMKVMRLCTDDLLKHWGLDPDVQNHLTRGVTSINRKVWAAEISSRYPWDLSRKGLNAVVNVLVLVDSAGKPTKCMMRQAFTNTSFQDNSCDLIMRKAQFTPALDAAGHPVSSYYMEKVVYHIGVG